MPVVVSGLFHDVRIDERADGPCAAAFVDFEPPRVTGVPELPLIHEVCRSHDDPILPQPGRGRCKHRVNSYKSCGQNELGQRSRDA
jgi:hypothetical protein